MKEKNPKSPEKNINIKSRIHQHRTLEACLAAFSFRSSALPAASAVLAKRDGFSRGQREDAHWGHCDEGHEEGVWVLRNVTLLCFGFGVEMRSEGREFFSPWPGATISLQSHGQLEAPTKSFRFFFFFRMGGLCWLHELWRVWYVFFSSFCVWSILVFLVPSSFWSFLFRRFLQHPPMAVLAFWFST